jgi:uncharacterized protein YecT (DUF1311 family)
MARADGVMGAIYEDLRSALTGADANALRDAQRGWLKQRDLTCPTSAADLRSGERFTQAASCLRRMTERRIVELSELLEPGARC